MTEESIIWLDDPAKYPYLRESCTYTSQPRKFRLKGRDGLVGYAVHKPNGSRNYCRRIWLWREGYDGKGVYAEDNFPAEAVLPESIQVGKPSPSYKPVLLRKKGLSVSDYLYDTRRLN